MEYVIIVATTVDGGIGLNGKIPWRIRDDMRHFKFQTSYARRGCINAVIMGRNTWESLPENMRPLQNRINIIVSESYYINKEKMVEFANMKNVYVVPTLNNAHAKIREMQNIHKVFVIGGERLYKEAMADHRYNRLLLTYIDSDIKCDAYFPLHLVEKRYNTRNTIQYGIEEGTIFGIYDYRYIV
jgi:dihydrofolate reductase